MLAMIMVERGMVNTLESGELRLHVRFNRIHGAV